MSNYIKVSVPKMKRDAVQLQANVNKIPQFVNDLDASMKNLGACWEGPAWIVFQQQVESDILYLLDMYDWLQKLLQTEAEAEKIYGESEWKSCNCIEKIRI